MRLYKQRLYLVPRHLITEADMDANGMDFHTYNGLRTKHLDNILPLVHEHHDEIDDLYDKIM